MSEAPAYEEFGTYRLTHLLGKGGMASVYRAVRSGPMGFAKEVAIKRIHDALIDNEAILKGLINEARIGGQLKHPNIVEIYEFNKVGEAYYLAMEFVDGWTLDKVVKLSREFKMPIPPSVILDIGHQICEGLEYAHTLESLDGQEVKLVHRDLKPANIILSRYGTAKIMDFGIAKAATNLFKTTMADVTKGTPHYMSPEQVAGAADLSGRSDLFALGALMYELTTGKVLFVGDALPTVLFNVVKAEVGPQIAEANERVPGLGPLLEDLLKKDPAERPDSAGAVAERLAALRESAFADGPNIKEFLYTLRDRMVLGATRAADSVADPSVADDTMPQFDDEPEFATMMAPAQRQEPAVNEGLVEARRAADAAIGAIGQVYPGSDIFGVDADSETMAAVPSSSEAIPAVPASVPPPVTTLRPKKVEEPPTKETHPNQRPTRKIKKRRSRSPALLVLLGLLGLVLVGGLGWIVKGALFGPAPVEEPAVAEEPVDLTIPDIVIEPASDPAPPAEGTSARPATTRDPRPDPTPGRATEPDSSPEVAAVEPLVEPGTDEPATPKKVVVAPISDPTPPPRRVEPVTPQVVTALPPAATGSGKGHVSIKTSRPYYARVWIDGIDTGKSTPLMRFELPAGQHTVMLVADQMKRKSEPRTISITADGHVKLGHYDFDSNTWDN